MSHNHYLECRGCGVTNENNDAGTNTPSSSYSKFASLGGDALVEQALAVRAIWKEPVDLFAGHGNTWALFIAAHAACNAFWEICGNGAESECGDAPRRIEVKGALIPCETCHGRRLVPCPDCPRNDNDWISGMDICSECGERLDVIGVPRKSDGRGGMRHTHDVQCKIGKEALAAERELAARGWPECDRQSDLSAMTCTACKTLIEDGVPVFLRAGAVQHVAGSAHCKPQ